MRPAQAALAHVLREHAIRTGEFVLASGRKSEWYVDGRLVTFRGDCVHIVGRAVMEALDAAGAPQFDAVGGLAIGADPVTVAVAAASGARGFAVRKEAKDHGVGGRIAGPLQRDDRVLVVDDTVTSGGSLLQAIDAVHGFGCTIVAAAALLDRGGELALRLEEIGVPYVPVLTAVDLGFAMGS
ncbi:MAG: orotate phosphoribosyltransferase [Actinobacteria bacterium]|nr:orotate phosphoribosyltransferase [Actinomycetota bacterium]